MLLEELQRGVGKNIKIDLREIGCTGGSEWN
jgi:hypothetical protein